MTTRPTVAADLPAITAILQTIELFPPELLGDMAAPYLSGEGEDIWFSTANEAGEVIGFGYCVPEQLTNGTYNLLAIGVRADRQGRGIGSKLMRHAEVALATARKRLLLVDTSGTEDFAPIRRFYTKLGYVQEAVIRDYWGQGDDKVTFWKRLG